MPNPDKDLQEIFNRAFDTTNNTISMGISEALPSGTNAIGKLAANTGVDIGDVDVTSIAAGANLVGDVGIAARASGGGTSIYTAGVTTAAAVKASAGQVYAIDIFNTTAAVAYLQVFNVAAASVTLGTTAPTYSIGIPASGARSIVFTAPVVHATAIAVAGTTTRTGATTAQLDVNIIYA